MKALILGLGLLLTSLAGFATTIYTGCVGGHSYIAVYNDNGSLSSFHAWPNGCSGQSHYVVHSIGVSPTGTGNEFDHNFERWLNIHLDPNPATMEMPSEFASSLNTAIEGNNTGTIYVQTSALNPVVRRYLGVE